MPSGEYMLHAMKMCSPPLCWKTRQDRRAFLKQAGIAAGGLMAAPLIGFPNLPSIKAGAQRPNVILIIVDDLNDWTPLLSNTRVLTPNLERLAKRSNVFTRAYCPSPACGPSRTSFLTGLQPSTTGVYFNNQSYRDAGGWLSEVVNIPQHFKANGYLTAGYGKVFHGAYQDRDAQSWSEGYYTGQESESELYAAAESVTNIDPVWPRSWGSLPNTWDRKDPARMQQDTRNAMRSARLIETAGQTPFFAALGIFRPHSRWFAPKRYFDLYPESELQIPEGYAAGDLDDLPPAAKWLAARNVTPDTHQTLVERGLWSQAIQAYCACITYADEQIGKVLDALDSSAHRNNTIIAVCSDHGYHLGEKNHWNKFTLWERSTRVPFLLSLPGQNDTGPKLCSNPVSLIDLFPTLTRLCRLPPPETHRLEGEDLSPILQNPKKRRRIPVLSTYGRGNHSVRSKRWRYIRYADESEELYDHDTDPHEWENLASIREYRGVLKRLRRHLPEAEAANIPFDTNRPVEWLDRELFQASFGPETAS